MKPYRFKVEVIVGGESAQDALECLQNEFDYLFGLDNQLQAAVYLDEGVVDEQAHLTNQDDEVNSAQSLPMTSQEYVSQGGQNCPFCASSNVQAQDLQMDGAIAWSTCACNDCDKEWKDLYSLTGYEVAA